MRFSRLFVLFSLVLLLPVSSAGAQERDPNINDRYVIEHAELRGVSQRDRAQFDDSLRSLIGHRLSDDEVQKFETSVRAALPDYILRRFTRRGSEPGRIRVVFDVVKADWARWLRFEPQDANLIYHSDQGWGARLPLSISGGDLLISPLFAFDVGDDLVEEYGGLGIRVESRRLGTERLGFLFDWSSFDASWRDATLTAIAETPGVPVLYDDRTSVTSVLKFAATRQLSFDGGVRVTELDALDDGGDSRMANAFIFAVNFSERPRESSRPRHSIEAGFVVRAGAEGLESDLVYQRYLGHGRYVHRRGHHLISVSGMAGRANGDTPLFERFSLGDSRTLRGWDKYDIAPLGATRMAHGSVEYRYRGVGMFVDAGSLWDGQTERRLRVSTGLTVNSGPFFMTVGFPVNTDEFRAAFTMGLRFSSASVKY